MTAWKQEMLAHLKMSVAVWHWCNQIMIVLHQFLSDFLWQLMCVCGRWRKKWLKILATRQPPAQETNVPSLKQTNLGNIKKGQQQWFYSSSSCTGISYTDHRDQLMDSLKLEICHFSCLTALLPSIYLVFHPMGMLCLVRCACCQMKEHLFVLRLIHSN